MKKVKAYIYTRVSSLEQVNLFGITRQLNGIKDFLENSILPKELGYQLDKDNYEIIESDAGLSGYHSHNFLKGNLGKWKERVRSGEITSGVLLFESCDRFTRANPYIAMDEFTFLINRGIDLIEVETETIFSLKIDNTLTKLSSAIERANAESKRKSRIITKSWANQKETAAKQKKALKRSTPAWLKLNGDDYVFNKDRVNAIQYIFEKYIDGKGVTQILKYLNKYNLKEKNKEWTRNEIHWLLRDRRVIGYLSGKKRKIDTGESKEGKPVLRLETAEEKRSRELKIYPEIVSLDDFEKVQRMIDSQTMSTKRRTSPLQRSLFNGIIRCGICNSIMMGQFSLKESTRGNYLRCLGKRATPGSCDSGLFRYDDSERVILEHIKGLDLNSLYSKEESPNDNTKAIASIQEELKILKAEIDDLLLEMNDSDDSEKLVLIKLRKSKRAKYDTLSSELNQLNQSMDDFKVDEEVQKFDISEVQNQANIELRQRINFELKKLVDKISVSQVVFDSEKHYLFRFQYHNSIINHILLTTKKGEMLAECYISFASDIMLVMSFATLNIKTGKTIFKKSPNKYEVELLEHVKQLFESAFEAVENDLHG